MERTISQEERIRRAEEIYSRRKSASGNAIRVSTNSVNTNKNKISLFKKMSLQLAICAVIYMIFYLIKNTNYIFSDDVISKTKEMLSYDINFGNAYAQISSFIEHNKNKFDFQVVNNIQEDAVNEIDTNMITNQLSNELANQINSEVTNTEEAGIGGAETNEVKESSADEEKSKGKNEENNANKTQMEKDAEYVKNNYSLIVPVNGTVTSRFGAREATEVVSANHQGIDIGANTGTAIYASMEGTVTLVSSEGDYR